VSNDVLLVSLSSLSEGDLITIPYL
jgi:hypothetical protein